MITILQLMALGNDNEVQFITTDESGEKRFLEIDKVMPILEPLNPGRFRHRKLLYGGLNNSININISPDLVYNSISDPDRCSKALERVQHAAKSNPLPFINHPDIIVNTRPDKLFQIAVHIEGITVPKCIRITPNSLSEVLTLLEKYTLNAPFIFKEAGTNPENKNSFFLESAEDIHQLERFAFDGRAYYVTQFYDYRSKDALYRKYRFFVIGNKIVPGHLIISAQWYITDDMQAHESIKHDLSVIVKEEKSFLKAYQKKRIPALITLQKKMGLDFYAIDCSIDEKGEVLLFNIDCEAHYFERVKKEHYYNDKQIHRYNEAVETMILNKHKEGGPHQHV